MPFTYINTHTNADATQLSNSQIQNNKIYIPEPELEDITLTENGREIQTKKILDTT